VLGYCYSKKMLSSVLSCGYLEVGGAISQMPRKTSSYFSQTMATTANSCKGLPLKVEARKRAFPSTEKADDVADLLVAYMKKHGVEVRTKCRVDAVLVSDKKIDGIRSAGEVYTAKNYLFATGGLSHPETGSTGDGFGWLKSLGHTVVDPSPTVVPIAVRDKWVHANMGVTLPAVHMSVYLDDVKKFRIAGDILCTHFGLSGPLILNNAKKVADLLQSGDATATIDLFPKLDHGALEKNIIEILDANKNKDFSNALRAIVPTGSYKGVSVAVAGIIDMDTKVHSFSKEPRKKLVHLLKAMPVNISGLMGFDRAVVADGGVPMSEIDPRTMRSNLAENLFVTGDLLHINRPSGGFSLQLCWTTGWVAGGHSSGRL
jgi:predicted Rossmann fold flavoprotein